MIITSTEYINCGLPIASDITEDEITLAIKTVELYYIKQFFGNVWQDIVEHPVSYSEIINGTDSTAGLKMAEYHAVFAYMIYDYMRLTRYHAVVKSDEHSENPSREDLLSVAKHHWEISTVFLTECAKSLGIKPDTKYNNLIFSELL